MTPDTAKHECKNLLASLQRLAEEQPRVVQENVRNLIQGLIDGIVDPETFTTELQHKLNSIPKLSLVPFLKHSLSFLQSALLSGELSIDGIRPPPRTQVKKKRKIDHTDTLTEQENNEQLKIKLNTEKFVARLLDECKTKDMIWNNSLREKDQRIQILETELRKTIDQNHMQIQHLEESRFTKVTDLEQAKRHLLETVAKKDEKIRSLEAAFEEKLVENHDRLRQVDILMEQEKSNLLDTIAEKDERIQKLKVDLEKTIHQKYKKNQTLKESDAKVEDLEQDKNDLLEAVAKKDEKIQFLKATLERTIDQNNMQTKNLEESVCKITDLEQQKINLLETVTEKDEKIQTLKVELKKTTTELTEMKKIRDDLQEQVEVKSNMAEVLINSDAKLKKLKNLLAAKVLLFDPNNENYETLCNLEVEELFSKYENTFKVNDSFKEKYEEIKEKLRSQTEKNEQCVEGNEKLIKVQTKLNVQMERNELLDKNLNKVMDTLSLQGKSRSFACIFPAIENLKDQCKSQEQEETEHYTNAQAVLYSIENSDVNI